MKKYLFSLLLVISIFSLTGCDDIFNKVDNFMKDKNTAVESTDYRSVEGHIGNIDYALMQEELKGNTVEGVKTYDELVSIFRNDGIYLPSNDSIRCESYTISKVATQKAVKCADMGANGNDNRWAGRTYSYTKGGSTIRDDD